jgi:prepilin-type N-terminal cleavage/methylation domain-containing protein
MPDQMTAGKGGCRPAFTLIELMLAIALSTVIVLTAVAAMRMAAQAITMAQRMQRANELIATGISSALDEVDFWNQYDDPHGGAAGQRLRASESPAGVQSATGHPLLFGLPFSPFNGSAMTAQTVLAGTSFPAVWDDGSAAGFGHGWQDDERLWAISADNELTWWTGNIAETQESDVRFGHYSIFGVSRLPSESTVVIDGGTSGNLGAWQPRMGGGQYGTITFGSEPHSPVADGHLQQGSAIPASYRHGTAAGQNTAGWLYNQIHGLSNALGWYGMMEYLPPCAIDCYSTQYHQEPGSGGGWMGSPADSTDSAGRPIYMIQTFSTVGWGYPNRPYYNLQAFSPNWCPHSMDFLTSYSAFGLLPVNFNRFEEMGGASANANPRQGQLGGANLSTDQLVFYHRSYGRMTSDDMPVGAWGTNNSASFVEPQYTTGAGVSPMVNGAAVMADFANRTSTREDMMGARPVYWPDITFSVARYLRLCRYSTQATVTYSDPLNGQQFTLAFTAMGTTLRGARRQRQLDGNPLP